ncbi:MAG: hypothetical protein JWR46_1600 [Mycobacterium sp.]|nr:hypothetical protein [Mycobacterium sp.]
MKVLSDSRADVSPWGSSEVGWAAIVLTPTVASTVPCPMTATPPPALALALGTPLATLGGAVNDGISEIFGTTTCFARLATVSASVGVLGTTASPLTDGTCAAAVDATSAAEEADDVEAVDASVGVVTTAEPWDVIGSGTVC